MSYINVNPFNIIFHNKESLYFLYRGRNCKTFFYFLFLQKKESETMYIEQQQFKVNWGRAYIEIVTVRTRTHF